MEPGKHIKLKIDILGEWNGKMKNKTELADLFGTDRRNINKMIGELEEKGVLEIGTRRILRSHEIRLLILEFG